MEMAKLVQMERFFIGLNKRMKRKNKTDIKDIIKKKCQILKGQGGQEEIPADQFYRMLEQHGIILSYKYDDIKYFYDEYGHDREFDMSLLDSEMNKSLEKSAEDRNNKNSKKRGKSGGKRDDQGKNENDRKKE